MADFSGVWRLDPAASTFHGPAPRSLSMKIQQRGPELTQHVVAADEAGKEQQRVFTCRIGAETISAIGETTLTCRARWEGDGDSDELVIETVMSRQGRDLLFKDHWSLSADGMALTMTHRDDALAGQTVRLIRDNDPSASDAFPALP
jgi:hypothetical protein